MPEPTPPPPKRPYSTPTLTRYGTLHEITSAVGNMGALDGGVPPQRRTSA